MFRDHLTGQFPFVVVPANSTATDLHRTKPFLFKVILLVASFEFVESQTEMAKEVMEMLSNRMIIGNEKSLDLLQGLLIFLAW